MFSVTRKSTGNLNMSLNKWFHMEIKIKSYLLHQYQHKIFNLNISKTTDQVPWRQFDLIEITQKKMHLIVHSNKSANSNILPCTIITSTFMFNDFIIHHQPSVFLLSPFKYFASDRTLGQVVCSFDKFFGTSWECV